MKPKDSITFKSQGLTHFCFKQNTRGNARGTINIKRGLGGHGNLGFVDMGPVLTKIEGLRDRISFIISEADYMKSSEVEFHNQVRTTTMIGPSTLYLTLCAFLGSPPPFFFFFFFHTRTDRCSL